MPAILIDIEAFVAALEAKQWWVALALGSKLVAEIAALFHPQQLAAAHAEAASLPGDVGVLADALKAKVAEAKTSAGAVPWGGILAIVLAILQKLFPAAV